MKALLAGLTLSLAYGAPLSAQDRDRSLERISIALERPLPVVRGVDPTASTLPKRLGIFTLVPPQRPGEMVRVSIPIGELVSRAFNAVGTAKQRRREAAARRRVAAELTWFEDQQPGPSRSR